MMDWDRKIPSWELAELEQQQRGPNIGGKVLRGLDLKLGGSGDLGSLDRREGAPIVLPPPSGSSSKRARAPSSGGQNVACSVDGCKADLSGCRDYHKRHKVCELHSKTPMVLVGGREQRFCQQCSRFHLLVEFDEVKRSCRKRLDGHNRRRRKPQPDALNSGSLFPVHQGNRFSSYQNVFTSPCHDSAWAALIKSEEDTINQDHQSFSLRERHNHSPPKSTFRIFNEGKQFPFLQDDNAGICNGATIRSPACQPLLSAASPSESCSRKMFSSVLDADCALSLLSSTSQALAGNLSPMEGIPFGQPLAQQFQDQGPYPQPHAPDVVSTTGFSCPTMDSEQVDIANLNCHGFFSVGASGASDGHPETLPFSW